MQVHAYAERRSKSWNGPAGSSRGALHDDENGAERKKLVRHERKLTAHPLMPKATPESQNMKLPSAASTRPDRSLLRAVNRPTTKNCAIYLSLVFRSPLIRNNLKTYFRRGSRVRA